MKKLTNVVFLWSVTCMTGAYAESEPHVTPDAELHFAPEAEPHFAAEPVGATAQEAPVQQVNPNGPRHNVHVANIACKNVECSAAKWFANAPDDHYLTIGIPRGVVDVFNVGNAEHRKALTVLDAKGKVAFQDGFGGDCYPNTCYGSAQLSVEYFADGNYTFKVVQVNNQQVLAWGNFTIQPLQPASPNRSKSKAKSTGGTTTPGTGGDAEYWRTQMLHRGVEFGNGGAGGVTYNGH